MTVAQGSRLGHDTLLSPLGALGPAFAGGESMNELRRGLAVAKERTR
jgi:hypothetical protein